MVIKKSAGNQQSKKMGRQFGFKQWTFGLQVPLELQSHQTEISNYLCSHSFQFAACHKISC
jgi:hypothetical protein